MNNSADLRLRNVHEQEGGSVGQLFDEAVDEMLRDCADRGEDDKSPRKVLYELILKPEPGGMVLVSHKITKKAPPLVSAPKIMSPETCYDDFGKRIITARPIRRSADLFDEPAAPQKAAVKSVVATEPETIDNDSQENVNNG